MEPESYYEHSQDMHDAISDAQTALNRIKECQSHIYADQALEAILSLIDATAKIRGIHDRRTH
jgi:hypothetical protein